MFDNGKNSEDLDYRITGADIDMVGRERLLSPCKSKYVCRIIYWSVLLKISILYKHTLSGRHCRILSYNLQTLKRAWTSIQIWQKK